MLIACQPTQGCANERRLRGEVKASQTDVQADSWLRPVYVCSPPQMWSVSLLTMSSIIFLMDAGTVSFWSSPSLGALGRGLAGDAFPYWEQVVGRDKSSVKRRE